MAGYSTKPVFPLAHDADWWARRLLGDSEVTKDEFPAELVERCAAIAGELANARWPESRHEIAIAVLRASGHAELVAALKPFVSDGPISQFEYVLAKEAARDALAAAGVKA